MSRWAVGLAAGLVGVLLVIAVATRQAGVVKLSERDCGSAVVVDGDPGGGQRSGSAVSVRVASWNARYSNTVAGIVAGVRAIGAHADVIGLQELNSPATRRAVAASLQAEWG